MARVLGEAHAALNPILPESYIVIPTKLADYLGAGLPVINSLPGESAALLREYEAGHYYPAKDVHSLAQLMERYIKNPDKVMSAGRNARALAEKMFDCEVSYPLLVRFIDSI